MVSRNRQTKPRLGGLDQTKTKSDQTIPITANLLYHRRILGPGVTEKIQLLRCIRHDNFVRVMAMIPREDPDIIDVHFEFMPIVMVDLCAKVFPHFTELALAAILGQ